MTEIQQGSEQRNISDPVHSADLDAVNLERDRAIEAVLRAWADRKDSQTLFLDFARSLANLAVDAILALPDPVRNAAREVVASFDHGFVPWDAFDRLRAALEESESK